MGYNSQLDEDKKMLNEAGFKAIAEQYAEMVTVLQRAVVRYDEISDRDLEIKFLPLPA